MEGMHAVSPIVTKAFSLMALVCMAKEHGKSKKTASLSPEVELKLEFQPTDMAECVGLTMDRESRSLYGLFPCA